LERIDAQEMFGCANATADVFDMAPSRRDNGLYFLGQNKQVSKDAPEPRPQPMVCSGIFTFEEGEFASQRECSDKDLVDLYSFVWNPQPDKTWKPKLPKAKAKKKKKRPFFKKRGEQKEEEEKTPDDDEFRLKLFLEKVGDLNHEEWKQVVAYTVSKGMDREKVCAVLNEHFQPEDPAENRRVFDSIAVDGVSKSSMVRLLQKGKNNWVEDEIWVQPAKRWTYMDFCKTFTGRGKKDPSAVGAAMKDMIVHIGYTSKMLYVQRKLGQIQDDHGVLLSYEDYDLSHKAPFSTTNDFAVYLGTKDENDKDETIMMSKIYRGLCMLNEIRTYDQLECSPRTTPPSYFNIWKGYPLQQMAFEPVNIENTHCYAYLRDVYGHGDMEHPQTRRLLNVMALYVQEPETRTCSAVKREPGSR